MTAKAATDADVGDNILGKITRTFADLVVRITNGTTDPSRARHLLGLATQNPRELRETDPVRLYVLEFHWRHDSSNLEYVTISLERSDGPGFECLIDGTGSERHMLELMSQLEGLYNKVAPAHGSRRMVRLYRVRSRSRFGRTEEQGDAVKRTCDLHFLLDPICDFKEGNRFPVPPNRENDRISGDVGS